MAVLLTEDIDLATEGATNATGGITYEDWNQYFVNGTAPGGTAFVRVSLGTGEFIGGVFQAGTGMFDSTINPQSAFFDEMSLIETPPGAGSGAGAVPEPSSLLMLVIGGALGLINVGRRQRR
jgi:hypothetical protein